MRRYRLGRAAQIAACVGLLLADAAVCEARTGAPARWYQVEVVIFRHMDPGVAGGEQWPELSALPDFSRAQRLLVDLPIFGDEPTIADDLREAAGGPIAFQSLSRADLKLSPVRRVLELSSSYQPMLHVAWRQPPLGNTRARGIYLADRLLPAAADTARQPALPLRQAVSYVEGTVRFSAARLLHVDLNFVYYGEGGPVLLAESRKVKLKELHYFDHPLFGVLVQVTPYRIPTAAPADGEAEPADELSAP